MRLLQSAKRIHRCYSILSVTKYGSSVLRKDAFYLSAAAALSSAVSGDLRGIDKKRIEIEERIDGDTQDVDIIELHELESTLVYFATSLRSNSIVLERLRRYKRLEQYPEDMELLEDVMVEYQQAIEMTAIYRDIIDGTRNCYHQWLITG